jgi:hypothetical protein
MSRFSTALYVASGVALLVTPVLQVRLHWKLARSETANQAWLGVRNHICLILAGASVAGLCRFANPVANLQVGLLLAIPLVILIVSLWWIFVLRLLRARW